MINVFFFGQIIPLKVFNVFFTLNVYVNTQVPSLTSEVGLFGGNKFKFHPRN